MKYNFVFSQADKRPMYEQIMSQIIQRIALGDWPPNTPLPSIRELAVDIKVSIITVKRAYLELEREGVIATQQGKGSWVKEALNLEQIQKKELIQHLQQAGKLACTLGLTTEELQVLANKYW